MARFTLTKSIKLLFGIVAAVLVVGLAVGAYVVTRYTLPSYNLSAQVEQAETALAGEDMVLLASLDTDYLKTLEEKIYGKAFQPELTTSDNEEEEPSLWVKLHRAGINPREAISAISGAAYITEDQGITGAIVLHGQFPMKPLRAFLHENYKTQLASGYGADAWVIQSENKTSCQLSRPWLVVHQERRLIIVDPGYAESLIARFKDSSEPVRDLQLWQRFRKERFAGAALFIPKLVPEKGVHPFIRASAEAARKGIEDFDALYLGASAKAFPPAGQVSLWLAGNDKNTVSTKASQWQETIQYSKKEWQKMLPTIAAMHDHMKVAVEGSAIMVDVEMDRALVEKAADIPRELLGMIFGGLMRGFKTSPEGTKPEEAPVKEVLAKDLPAYLEHYSLGILKPYNPKVQFGEKADVTSGPFGINLKSVALSEKEGAGIELTIESIGTEIANLGKDVGGRVKLAVTGVQDEAGNELLRRESCGKERNDKPAKVKHWYGDDKVKNEKTVRLIPSATPSKIASIKGYVRLRLPTEVETITISQPKVGTAVEENGIRIEITKFGGKSVSYRLSGAMSNLLEVRALNANNQPLQSGGSWSSGGMFGGGKSVGRNFRGNIKQLEFIIATKSQVNKYPYELNSARPKNARENTHGKPLKLLPLSLAQFERAVPRNFAAEPNEPLLAETRTGPFIVRLRSIGSFFGLVPQLEVVTAEVKGLDQLLSVGKIELDSLILKNKTRHRTNEENGVQWQNLNFSNYYGKKYLQGRVSFMTKIEAEPENLESLRGKIVFRAPSSVSPLVLDKVDVGQSVSMGDFSAVLTKLSRNGFVLKGQSQKTLLLGVEAFNTENKLLWMSSKQLKPTNVGWEGNFSVSGVPSKIVLYVTDKYEEKIYPFKLSKKN